MTDPRRLLGQLPRWLTHHHAPLAASLGADWLAEGFTATGTLLHAHGPTAYATRTIWADRGYPAVAAGGQHDSTNPDPHPFGLSDRTGDSATRTIIDDPLTMYQHAITATARALLAWQTGPTVRAQTSQVIARIDRLQQLTITAVPAAPNTTTRRRLNIDSDPGCQHCQRYGHWSPPISDVPSTVNGNIPEPLLLCRWCRDVVRRHGALPSQKHVEAHRTGDQATIRRINTQLQQRRGA
jgi:hypothetical protein